MERQPVQQHPLKEHLFCLFCTGGVGKRERTEGRSPECAVNTRCQESLLEKEKQDGSILQLENLSWFVRQFFSSSLGVVVDLWPVSVASPYHATLSQFR